MHLCSYIMKEVEPHSENFSTWLPAMGLGSLSPILGEEGSCYLLFQWMVHRWLSTSFPVHACQKLLGLKAQISVPYY